MANISSQLERLIRLDNVPACFAGSARVPSVRTVRRWVSHGVKARSTGAIVKLEAVQIGGWTMTTLESVERFIESTNSGGDTPPATTKETEK